MWARPDKPFGTNYTKSHWFLYDAKRDGFVARCGAGINMDYPLGWLKLDETDKCRRCDALRELPRPTG